MTSPRTPNGDSAASAVCAEPGCERPAVLAAAHCRVHLADVLRDEGQSLPFTDPELTGLYAAAVQIVRTALTGLPQDLVESGDPAIAIDMYAWLSPDAEWQIAQFALDCLGTNLLDTGPIGGTVLSPPMKFKGEILLRLQVGVPAASVDEFLPRLELALESMVREVVGPDVSATFAVEPAE
jgi:hypothetical protein